ncbi:Insc-C domain-containing protein [Aphelenchoides bicaudatus]|nr:Insc-C domain-containing protein [Aphelenchoides bicaudatus]
MSSSSSCESLDDKRKCRGRNFARSMPSVASLSLSLKKSECSEPKVRMRHNRTANTNNLAYRHTIRIGDEKADEIFNNNRAADTLLTKCSNISNANLATVSTRSPNSSDDSGQFSGRHSYLKSTQIMSDSTGSSDFSNHLKTSLPSYARMASTMDHILRTANTIYSLLDSNLDDPKVTRELIQKVQIYIQILQQSPCQPFLAEEDFTLVTNTLHQINSFSSERSQAYLKALDYSNVAVRRMLEQSLIVLLRITTNYLNECTNRDRLLIIALEHLVHLLLFGDELCLEAIRCRTVDNIVGFCRLQTTSNDTLRLLLRVLAVLCGVGRGCVQLISIGGLDLIIQLFNSRPPSCATEAAGILTQLTSNPNQPFIRLACTQLDKIVDRLLELIDDCRSAESLLLCSAALANFSMLNTLVIKMLYERNAIQRLVNALKGPNNCTIFIQEQIVIIFSQLAAYSYEQALVAQGAIPVLLKMLRAGETMPQRFDYSRRIRYKAAVCLATIASNSLGLKYIHENYGCEALEIVLERENFNEK